MVLWLPAGLPPVHGDVAVGGVACSWRWYLQSAVLLGSIKEEEACGGGVACSWRCCVQLAVWCCRTAMRWTAGLPSVHGDVAVGDVACSRPCYLQSAVLLAVGGDACSRRCCLQLAVLLAEGGVAVGGVAWQHEGGGSLPLRKCKCNCTSNNVNIIFILFIS